MKTIIKKLEPYIDSVICFMSCAYVDKLIDKTKELIVNQPKDDE